MAKYQELYHQMTERILRGDYGNSGRLPSTAELAKQMNVSYITAHKVYELLCRNNLVEAKRGQGFFVRNSENILRQFEDKIMVGKVGLFLNLASNDFYGQFYQGLVMRLLRIGHAPVSLGHSWMMHHCTQEEAKKVLLSIAASGVQDLIIHGDIHFPYRALWEVRKAFRKIVFVMFYSGEMPFDGAYKVVFDMHKAGMLAGDYLLKSGFSKLVFMTQEPVSENLCRKHGISRRLFDLDMLDGVENACRNNGIDFGDTGRVIARNVPYNGYEDEVRHAIESALDDGCNGFVCMNDLRALLLYQIARERGLEIGRDVGITGNFNTPMCELVIPPLSSIDLNVSMLLEYTMKAIQNGGNGETIKIEPNFITR